MKHWLSIDIQWHITYVTLQGKDIPRITIRLAKTYQELQLDMNCFESPVNLKGTYDSSSTPLNQTGWCRAKRASPREAGQAQAEAANGPTDNHIQVNVMVTCVIVKVRHCVSWYVQDKLINE